MGRSRRSAIDAGTDWLGNYDFFVEADTKAEGYFDHSKESYSDYIVVSPIYTDFEHTAEKEAQLATPFYKESTVTESTFVVWGPGVVSFGDTTELLNQQIAFMANAVALQKTTPTSPLVLTGFPGAHIALLDPVAPGTIHIGIRNPNVVGFDQAYTVIEFGDPKPPHPQIFIYPDHLVVSGTATGIEFSIDGKDPIILTNGSFDLRPLITIDPTPGSANITGGGAPETINGTDGSDTILQGIGAAIINAGGGNDLIQISPKARGATDVHGGAGTDTMLIDLHSQISAINLTLPDSGAVKIGSNTLVWDNLERIDVLGGNDDDVIVGNALDNRLDGGAGADHLSAGAGNDTLIADPVPDAPIGPQTMTSSDMAAPVNLDQSFRAVYADYPPVAELIIPSLTAYGRVYYSFTADAEATINISDVTNFFDINYYITMSIYDSSGNLVGYNDNSLYMTLKDGGVYTLEIFSNLGAGLNFDLEFSLSSAVPQPPVHVFDTLDGGTGDDTFYVNDPLAVIIERPGEGTDTIITPFDYSLAGREVENLTLTGTAAINAAGNSLVNTLIGNSAANVINGLGGADIMRGGQGDDTYIVDNTGDKITEAIGEGTDTVQSSVTYSLGGQYLETLQLTGTAAINATGNSLVNTLIGNSAANVINGLGGADIMRGGQGDDTYIVDNTGDKITEAIGEGTDTVQSSVSYSLGGQYLEVLQLTGTAAINATGNSLVNTLIGNSAANLINGLGGADIMRGGQGDDTYIVDNTGDKITEAIGEGTDTVQSSVSYSLGGQYLEVLQLTGTAAINATGNSLANTLTGNGAANILNGMGGADTMSGGLGDDTYVVDNTGDKVIEAFGAGNDTILSSVSYSLVGPYAETLQLTGSAAITAGGNTQPNTLIGNSAANLLDGRGGIDTLTGGGGADTFRFSMPVLASNADRITDFVSGTDRIALVASVFTALTAGALDPAAFQAGTAAASADDHLIYDIATGRLWYDADGQGGTAQTLVATLTPGAALTATDVIVI